MQASHITDSALGFAPSRLVNITAGVPPNVDATREVNIHVFASLAEVESFLQAQTRIANWNVTEGKHPSRYVPPDRNDQST